MPSWTEAHGPIFDGRAEVALLEMCDKIDDEVARAGKAEVLATLGSVLRHPTGYYESQITTTGNGNSTDITDGGVIYGPWLEGVGSRNRTTRFKGYATFRRVAQQLDAQAGPIAERVADVYVRRMG